MSRVERIGNRLPRFYKDWDEGSLFFSLLRAVSRQLDAGEEDVTLVMKSHWVDTAVEDDLNRLGGIFGLPRLSGEDDSHFRARLKRAVDEYQGGGTISAVRDAVKALVNARSEEDVRVVENPHALAFAEFEVRSGDTWTLGSMSIQDEQPTITVTVEEGGTVNNPQVTNLDTGESVTFEGELGSGQRLVIREEETVIEGKDASAQMSPRKVPWLLRRGSTWRYSESLTGLIGVFDTASFNEHMFAVAVPAVRIRFDWTKLQPATFEVHVTSKVLRESGVSQTQLEGVINFMKAAGVHSIIKVME